MLWGISTEMKIVFRTIPVLLFFLPTAEVFFHFDVWGKEPAPQRSHHYVDGSKNRVLALDLDTQKPPESEKAFSGKKTASEVHEPEISIVELQNWATQHNPTLKMLRQKINAAHGNWIQAGLAPNPTVGYEAEEVGDGGKAGKHGVVLEQEVITGGKRRLGKTVAALEKESERQRWEARFQSIQNDVRARAYEVLAAQKIVAINENLTTIGDQSVQAAEELGKAGEVSRIDLLQIRAKANESRLALATSKNEEELAWKKLAVMVGMQNLAPHRISDSLENVHPTLSGDEAWQYILDTSPQLAAARLRIRQARVELAKECAERIPDITVGGGVHYDYGERQTLGSFNVGVPLRIFDKNQGNIRKSQAELAVACRDFERQSLVLYESFLEIRTALENARKQIELYQTKILPDVHESLQLSLKGYKQGEYGYMDVLSAQQLYLESQTQYVQALKDHAVSCVYLEGYLATGGLETVD